MLPCYAAVVRILDYGFPEMSDYVSQYDGHI